MSDKPDHDTTPARPGPAGEDGKPTTSATSREPLITADPLGLGGTPDPDAPSRRPRPKIVALLGEFFKMSRTTAILLVTFVLIGILYSMVKDEPVLRVDRPSVPSQTVVPPEEVTTPSSSEQVTETSVPTEPTTSAPTSVTTEDPASGSQETTTSGPDRLGNQTTVQLPQGTQQQAPQQQQTQQQQTQQQPQPQLQPQQVPDGAAGGPTGAGQPAE